LIIYLLTASLWAQEHFVIYVNKHISNNNALKRWQPTVDYLNQKLPKYHFTLLPIEPTRVDHIKKLLSLKKIDFLITQPAIYTELKYTHNVNAILTMANKYKMSTFGSVIITHKNSGIKSIEDLKNRDIAAVAPFGFGGWLIAYNELIKHKIDPIATKQVEFVGSQKKVFEAVVNQRVSVGILRTGMLEKFSRSMNIDNIRIINEQKSKHGIKLSTDLFPEWAFAVASHIDTKVSNGLFNALVQLQPTSHAARAGEYHDWHLPHSYSKVDKLLERFRLGHYQSMPMYTLEDILTIVAIALLVIFTLIIYGRYKVVKMISKRLQNEVHLKTKELEKTNVELVAIFDLNPHITIITDGKHIQRVNRRFLDFLEIKTLSEFTNEYDCICDQFESREGYLQAQMGDQTWIEYVDTHPSMIHKAMIIQHDREYIFSIHVANIHYLDNASYIVTLEDITKINTIAFTDKLTTLYNRSRLDEKLSWLYENYSKEKKIFTVALIDIDHFKCVNDKYGHIIGDRVLIDLAKLLQNNSRDSDTVGRWGGEEFMIIYENISAQSAYRFIERIRKAIESYDFVTAETQTVSIGIAQYSGEDITIKEFIDQADQALYQAKNSGRNQTVVYT